MAGYATIYSPDGEPFEVGEERASHLLLNCGWTRIPQESSDAVVVVNDEPGEEVCDVAEETATDRRKGRGR